MDERIALSQNEILADKYTIVSELGRGGTCIVYEAEYSDDYDYKHRVRIKEFYPYQVSIVRKENQALVCADKYAEELFQNKKKSFVEGYHKNVELQYDDDFVNTSVDAREIIEKNGTLYVIYSIDGGVTLDKYKPSNLNECIKIAIALSKALLKYHERGYLHLDIKPDNILILNDTKDIVILFDYDSVIRFSDLIDGFDKLSYSDGFSAPELVRSDIEKIGVETDVFSVGAILYEMIWGKVPNYSDMDFGAEYDWTQSEYENKSTRSEVFYELTVFFHNTLSSIAAKRYKGVNQLLDALYTIYELADPDSVYIISCVPTERYFIGRDNELNQISEYLDKSNTIILTGIGGIGKSIIAEQYAVQNRNRFKYIIQMSFAGSLNEMICNDSGFAIANFDIANNESISQFTKRKISKLKQLCNDQTLIIIDNIDTVEFDNEELWIWGELLSLNAKVIITSRIEEWAYPSVAIKEIRDNNDKLELFHKYCSSTDDENINKIIEFVQGHTALIELIAKQIEASFSSPEELYCRLVTSGIKGTDSEKVIFNKDNTISIENVLHQAKSIFNLFGMSNQEKYILHNLCLFSVVNIDAKEFKEYVEIENFDAVNSLIRRGWIQRKGSEISMHPVIADVIGSDNSEVFSDVIVMLRHLTKLMNEIVSGSNGQTRIKYKLFCGMVVRYLLKIDESDEASLEFVKEYTRRFKNLDGKDTIEKAYFYILEVDKKIHDEYSDTQLIFLHDLANYYRKNSEYKKSLYYYELALDKTKSKYGENHPQIGAIYNGLGTLYKKIGEYNKAEDYLLLSLEYIDVDSSDKTIMKRKAIIYNNLGTLYMKYNVSKAEYYLLEAFDILKEVVGYNNNYYTYDLCGCMVNLGEYYIITSRFDEARDMLTEAKRICDLMYDGKGRLAIDIYDSMKKYYLAVDDISMVDEIEEIIEKLKMDMN